MEYDIYFKYSDRQAPSLSIDPDRTPMRYDIYFKYSDRQAIPLSNSVEPDRTDRVLYILEH